MYINDKLYANIQNLTTTTIINSHLTSPPDSFDDNDMTRTLSYAIPLSCFAIFMVLLIAVGIHRRHHVLEKWSSLKRMKNTDPRIYERAGLRGDSIYEAYNDSFVHVTGINEDAQIEKKPECSLATIT